MEPPVAPYSLLNGVTLSISILKILMSVRCPSVPNVRNLLSERSYIVRSPLEYYVSVPPPLEYYMSVPPLKWLFGPARSFYTSPCLCVGLSVGLSMGKTFNPLPWHLWSWFWHASCFFYLTRRNSERRKTSKIFWGRLSNPNFKVFFIAISIIEQARRLIFGMRLDFNLTRRSIERNNWNFVEVVFQIQILRSSS